MMININKATTFAQLVFPKADYDLISEILFRVISTIEGNACCSNNNLILTK